MDLQRWIDGIKAGREEAFEAFIRRYSPDIARVVSRFCLSGADREEWIDIVLLHAVDRILNGKLRFLSVKAFNVWLFRLARHKCIECWRRGKRSQEHPTDSSQLDRNPDPDAARPEAGMEQIELKEIVAAAIGRIPKSGQRETMALVWIEGLSVAEVALKLGRPINTIRTWERRGKQVFTTILQRDFPEIVEEFGER